MIVEFIFRGANIEEAETDGRFGVAPDRAQSYHSDSTGAELNYRVVSEGGQFPRMRRHAEKLEREN